MSENKIPSAPVIPPAPSVKSATPKAPAKATAPKVEQKDEPAAVQDDEAPSVKAEAAVEQPAPPTLVRFRAPFELSMPFQRIKFYKGQVVSSLHYDLQRMLKQGAQLDVVEKNERGEFETIMDLSEV